jgi:hypothetical protein
MSEFCPDKFGTGKDSGPSVCGGFDRRTGMAGNQLGSAVRLLNWPRPDRPMGGAHGRLTGDCGAA